jgi:hypothetical protein
MNSAQKARYNRLAKQKERGTKISYLTRFEDAAICLAWEAGELSEGQAATALGVDRIGARLRREAILGRGVVLAARLKQGRPEPAQEAEP